MERKRSNQDLAVIITEELVNRGLIEVLEDFEYTDETFEIQDTILEMLNKYQPLNNDDN